MQQVGGTGCLAGGTMVPQAGPPPVSSVPSVSSRTDQHNTEVEALHGEAKAKCHVSLHDKWSIARVYEPTGEPVREADIGNWAPKHALDAYGPCFADWYSPHAKPCHPHSPSRLRCCIESLKITRVLCTAIADLIAACPILPSSGVWSPAAPCDNKLVY